MYEEIYFAQGDDALEDIEAIDAHGAEVFALELVEQIYLPGEHVRRATAPWSEDDEVHRLEGGFVLYVDRRAVTVGLARILDEET